MFHVSLLLLLLFVYLSFDTEKQREIKRSRKERRFCEMNSCFFIHSFRLRVCAEMEEEDFRIFVLKRFVLMLHFADREKEQNEKECKVVLGSHVLPLFSLRPDVRDLFVGRSSPACCCSLSLSVTFASGLIYGMFRHTFRCDRRKVTKGKLMLFCCSRSLIVLHG